jgi:hypothetical protein
MKQAAAIVEGDVVLVYVEHKPAFFARVERIDPDVKPKWWRVKFLILTLPLTVTTWIIDDEQIRGADFTMGGTPIRIEKVVAPEEKPSEASAPPPKEPQSEAAPKQARILSLGDRKKET